MLKRMSSTGSQLGSGPEPKAGSARTTVSAQQDGELSRAESARRVLEARRGKKKNDTPNAATPGMSSLAEVATPTSQTGGVSQMLGGRLLQGIHDILMVMDEKVESLVADVNNMRADFSGLHLQGSTERQLHEIQSKVDVGLATIFSQLKQLHAFRSEGDHPASDGHAAHIPGSRQVELIGHGLHAERQRISSSNASSMPDRSELHDVWEAMEHMEKMDTEDLIQCESITLSQDEVERQLRAASPGNAFPTLESSQDRPQDSKPPTLSNDEILAAVASRISSRVSSARNSRISTAQQSPLRTSQQSQRRTSVSRSGSKERVTFEGITREKSGGKLPTSKSRVDEFRAIVKPRQRSALQKYVWNFLEDPDLVRGGRTYGNILFITIIISAVLPILPSPIDDDWFLLAMQYGLLSLDCLFFVEVMVRFYGAPHRLRFFGSFQNWLDIVSVIVPVGLKIRLQSLNLAADAHLDVEFIELSLIVMVPVLRLLKLLRRFENSHLIKQAFRDAIGALPSLLYCMMVLVVGFSAIIYVLEPRGNVETMPRAIWFTMVTLTTVGYGDMVPVSPGGNVVVCVLMIVSAMYMAMPLGIVGKAFGSVWDDRHRLLLMQRLRTRFSTVGYDPQDIPTLFCSYDENGDGELSMEEFRQMLQQLEVEAMDERAHDVFAAFDNDGSGAIDDSEFIKTLFPTAYKSMYREEDGKEEEAEDAPDR